MAFDVISVSSLSRSVRAGDSTRFKVKLKKNRLTILQDATTEALTTPPILKPFSRTKIRGKYCVSYKRYNDNLVVRAISAHLRRRLRISTIDRHVAIEGIVQGLLDGTPTYVLRRDIRDFYESVDISAFKDRLLFDPLVTPRVRAYLKHFFDQHCPVGSVGLPRGIGLSALLVELHMQEFDNAVRSTPGVYRYYRFADDIFIFSDAPPNEVGPKLDGYLPPGMSFNPGKSVDAALGTGASSVEYLGYKFDVVPPRKDGAGRSVKATMSPKKLSRLKSRIIVSAKAYAKNGGFDLLFDRLRFITSNYEVLRRGQNSIAAATHVRSGIYYNYLHCGTYSVSKAGLVEHTPWDGKELRAMDGFLNSVLFGASSKLRVQIASRMSAIERHAIRRLSFYHGYHSRMLVRLRPHRIAELKSVWRNV